MIDPVTWKRLGDDVLPGRLRLIDQTRLPRELVYVELDELEPIIDAIRRLVVRGAPAIGCAAAYGLAAVCQHSQARTVAAFGEAAATVARLAAARPTAVNSELGPWNGAWRNSARRRARPRPDALKRPDRRRDRHLRRGRVFACHGPARHGAVCRADRHG